MACLASMLAQRCVKAIAVLLLTIGAGGGLKQTLLDAGVSQTISKVAEGAHMPYLLLAWLIAVALRQATGSALWRRLRRQVFSRP